MAKPKKRKHSRRRRTQVRSIENPNVPITDELLAEAFGATSTDSGIRVTKQTAITLSALWRAYMLVSTAVAKLPLFVWHNLPEGGKDRDKTHAAHRLLRRQANDEMSAFTVKRLMIHHAMSWGNGYCYIERSGSGRPIGLIPMRPDFTHPVRIDGQLMYKTQLAGRDMFYQPHEIFHIKGLSNDGLAGYDVVSVCAETLGHALATRKYGAMYFRNNARPDLVLEHPGELGGEAHQRVKKSWNEKQGGLDNAHKIAILEEGMKAHELSSNAKDAQLVESLKLSTRDVANVTGVPMHKLGDDSKSSYSSLEQENQSFLNDTLEDWLCTYEDEAFAKLLSTTERNDETHTVEFLRQAAVRADMSTRQSFYSAMIQNGVMTRDEVRSRENLNPLPDGSGAVALVPLNLAPATGEPDANANADTNRAAHRELLIETIGRMVRRLEAQAGKAAKRSKMFGDYLERDVYSSADVIAAALNTPLTVIVGSRAAAESQRLAAQMVAETRRVLSQIYDRSPCDEFAADVSAAMTTLCDRLPAELADSVLDHGDRFSVQT